MKKYTYVIRSVIIFVVFALILGVFVVRLADWQVKQGEYFSSVATAGSTGTVKVKAARGEIVDRYGRSLAINVQGYALNFDRAYLPADRQNEIILTTIRLLEDQGEEWNDLLPISRTSPFVFLDGQETRISSILAKFRLNKWATAQNVIDEMAATYKVSGFTPEETRLIVSVRYAMDIRGFSVSNPYTIAGDVSMDTVQLVEENNFQLPGVAVEQVATREYVSGTIAPHLIGQVTPIYADEYQALKEQGYAMNDSIGRGGIEEAFESYLRGKDGEKLIHFDSSGKVLSEEITVEPEAGGTVIMTLDSELQQFVQDALGRRIREIAASAKTGEAGFDACAGAVVVEQVKTGELLACASYPGYDLSTYLNDYNALAADTQGNPLWNRATLGLYAPGSTFKPAVTIAALAEGIVTPTTEINCTGVYTFYQDYQPTCMGVHGWITLFEALRVSCNSYYYEAGRQLGIQPIIQYANALGLGVGTGLEVDEASGQISSPEYRQKLGGDWVPGDVIATAIGQSDTQVTPVQLAAYAATLANDGVRLQSHLVKEVKRYTMDTSLYMAEPTVLSDLSAYQDYFEDVRTGMVSSGQTGTVASWFADFDVLVACKTGTPQTGHTDKSNNATFIAYAPADDPEIAVSIVIERGGHGYYLAPLMKEILSYYFDRQTDSPDTVNSLLP